MANTAPPASTFSGVKWGRGGEEERREEKESQPTVDLQLNEEEFKMIYMEKFDKEN